MSNSIKNIKRIIDSQFTYWENELKNLQSKCKHKNKDKVHRSSTGNYDPSADRYWTEFRCNDCGKFWSEDGSV